MKLSDVFKSKRKVGWQGQSSEPSPVLIGAIVALLITIGYVVLVVFGHKG